MADNREISVERAEKISSLIRNCFLIFGGIFAAFASLYPYVSNPVTAHARNTYINGDKIKIKKPRDLSNNSYNIGTLSVINIVNNTKKPGKLDILLLNIDNLDSISGNVNPSGVFQVVSWEAGCLMDPKHVSAPLDGLVEAGKSEKITVSDFPPGCQIDIVITSPQINSAARLMSGNIALYFDGNQVSVDRSASFYGDIFHKFQEIFGNRTRGFLIYTSILIIFTAMLSTVFMFLVIRRSSQLPHSVVAPVDVQGSN